MDATLDIGNRNDTGKASSIRSLRSRDRVHVVIGIGRLEGSEPLNISEMIRHLNARIERRLNDTWR